MSKSIKLKQTAFSLIEVITVLFVVSLGMVGVLTLIVQNIQSQQFNRQNIIAYQLAQEGIELIRNVRDSNWLIEADWNENLDAGIYYMDYNDSIPTVANAGAATFYLDADGFYSHDVSTAVATSSYTRSITLVDHGTSSLQVISRVNWADRNKTFSYILETILYDWR